MGELMMTKNVEKHLQKLVQDNNHGAYELSAQIIQLEVVQQAVARLLERIDDIVYNGWNKDRGMAYMAIDEIRDTVRLIDLGFCPLTKSIGASIAEVNKTSDKLFELMVSKSTSDESSNTTPQVEEAQSV